MFSGQWLLEAVCVGELLNVKRKKSLQKVGFGKPHEGGWPNVAWKRYCVPFPKHITVGVIKRNFQEMLLYFFVNSNMHLY